MKVVNKLSVRFIGSMDLKMKNRKPNQARSILIGSILNRTRQNRILFWFGSV